MIEERGDRRTLFIAEKILLNLKNIIQVKNFPDEKFCRSLFLSSKLDSRFISSILYFDL